MHNRNPRVSFTRMPAPSVFGWPEQRDRQRAIPEQAAPFFESSDLLNRGGRHLPLEQAADAYRALKAET